MGHKYYVYVGPGHIKYFDDLTEAQEYANYYDTFVKEIQQGFFVCPNSQNLTKHRKL